MCKRVNEMARSKFLQRQTVPIKVTDRSIA